MEGLLVLKDYQKSALDIVRKNAQLRMAEPRKYLEQCCQPFGIDAAYVLNRVLQSPVTINFHPDRLSNNGKTVMQNLLEEGIYESQFRTGTSNGGKTAFIGGDRFLWEQRMFHHAYPQESLDRPKYGALNIFRYIDGASVRFGSCYFVLKPEVTKRCTFAYGDSSINPDIICTDDTFWGVAAALLQDVDQHTRLLNQAVSSQQEALAILLNPSNESKTVGRNLDFCIETHIHGDISLQRDIQSFYLDRSFQETVFERQAETLCSKYDIELKWIPERRVQVNELGTLFRGPLIPILARKIDEKLGSHQGILNAYLIGLASQDSQQHPQDWKDIGNEEEMFQYLKQLWHTVGYFGI